MYMPQHACGGHTVCTSQLQWWASGRQVWRQALLPTGHLTDPKSSSFISTFWIYFNHRQNVDRSFFSFFQKSWDYIARPVPAGLLAYSKWISFSMCFCQVRSYRGRAYWMYFWSSWISWRFWHEEGKQRMDFESRALSMLCKCSTTELHPSASLTGSYKTIIFGIQNYMVYSLLSPLGVVFVIP